MGVHAEPQASHWGILTLRGSLLSSLDRSLPEKPAESSPLGLLLHVSIRGGSQGAHPPYRKLLRKELSPGAPSPTLVREALGAHPFLSSCVPQMARILFLFDGPWKTESRGGHG